MLSMSHRLSTGTDVQVWFSMNASRFVAPVNATLSGAKWVESVRKESSFKCWLKAPSDNQQKSQ